MVWASRGRLVAVCSCNGRGLVHTGDQDSIHYMCREAPKAVLELESYGYGRANHLHMPCVYGVDEIHSADSRSRVPSRARSTSGRLVDKAWSSERADRHTAVPPPLTAQVMLCCTPCTARRWRMTRSSSSSTSRWTCSCTTVCQAGRHRRGLVGVMRGFVYCSPPHRHMLWRDRPVHGRWNYPQIPRTQHRACHWGICLPRRCVMTPC